DDVGGVVATGAGAGTSATGSVAITLAPVNDAVTITSATATVAEDGAVTLTGLSISDVDALLPSGTSGQYSVTLTAHNGTLNDGVHAAAASLTLTGTLASLNTALANISYHGNSNFNGTDTIDLSVTDQVTGQPVATGSGTATTGTGSDVITVTAVNDQVAISNGDAKSINEDAPVTLTGIVISDVDAVLNPGGQYSVTLTADHGTLNDGVHPVAASLTLTGTLASLNTALGSILYTPDANYNG